MRCTQLGTGAPRELQGAHFTLDRDCRSVSFGRAGSDWMPYSALIGAIEIGHEAARLNAHLSAQISDVRREVARMGLTIEDDKT